MKDIDESGRQMRVNCSPIGAADSYLPPISCGPALQALRIHRCVLRGTGDVTAGGSDDEPSAVYRLHAVIKIRKGMERHACSGWLSNTILQAVGRLPATLQFHTYVLLLRMNRGKALVGEP